jgi:hypothetical protein
MAYLPPPTGIAALNAPLSVETELTFDTGNPQVDRAAKLLLSYANIPYDQVTTVSVDVGVTERDNDISVPKAAELVPIYKPSYDPELVQVVAILLTCEFGEAALYFATKVGDEEYFDPPDVDALIPLPLVPGGWFLYVDDHEYETATWQAIAGTPVFIGEILAASFLPSRITGYVFLKNRGV